ncbi:MAG TPA: hypothetical protein DHU96_25865 [Actinobacteria bacterium]|nr:hypothetical protein [Actinomycetota bacterium]
MRRLIMAATPADPGAAPGYAIPDDDAADEDVDVLYLAGERPTAEGAWLWVTTAEARRGGEFTALFLPRTRPSANGGDVLLHIAPGATPDTEPGPTARVRVAAVVAGSVIHVAGWDHLSLEEWPETARPTVTFAMGALKELQEHGADVGAHRHPSGPVEVESAAEAAVTGFPALPTSVRPTADG